MTVRRPCPAVLLLALLVLGGCTREQLGLPRIPLSVTSPDGKMVAFVRNHPDIDPPNQSIWLGATGHIAVRLQQLGADADWCDSIVWSADSSTVSYLIQGARLVTADARTQRVVSEKWLTEWKGEYPAHRIAVELALSSTGREARFRDCTREIRRPGRGERPGDCADYRTMTIRDR